MEFYTAMAKGGWIGIAIPEMYGGGGAGIGEAAAVLEEVAASGACMNGASAIHLSIFGMHPVVLHGSDEMKRRYLPSVADGTLHVAFGVTKPDAGTDTTKITTRAVRDGDRYVVNGRKVWTSKALEADRILLLDAHHTIGGMRQADAGHDSPAGRPPRTRCRRRSDLEDGAERRGVL